jgi:hypothetical protein
MNVFKKVYRPRNNSAKYENGDLLADSHNLVNKWKNYIFILCQLLNVLGFNDVWRTQMERVEPLVHKPGSFGVHTSNKELNRYKSPGMIQFQQNSAKQKVSELHKLINSTWNNDEMP